MGLGLVTYKGVSPVQFRDEVAYIAAPELPGPQRLLAIWQTRPADGLMMGRDVPSRALAPLLSHLVVWEPLNDATDFRVRLAGDTLHRRFDGDIKGRLMSELFPVQDLAEHLQTNRRAINSDSPVFLKVFVTSKVAENLSAEVVILPIVSPDRASLWTLSGAFFL